MKTVRIGITIGDVNGIGPEVALKALRAGPWPARARFVLYGSEAVLRREARRLGLEGVPAPVSDALLGTAVPCRPGRSMNYL